MVGAGLAGAASALLSNAFDASSRARALAAIAARGSRDRAPCSRTRAFPCFADALVTEGDTAVIRAIFDRDDELPAAMELRRRFPAFTRRGRYQREGDDELLAIRHLGASRSASAIDDPHGRWRATWANYVHSSDSRSPN
jgi:hypothetical protein